MSTSTKIGRQRSGAEPKQADLVMSQSDEIEDLFNLLHRMHGQNFDFPTLQAWATSLQQTPTISRNYTVPPTHVMAAAAHRFSSGYGKSRQPNSKGARGRQVRGSMLFDDCRAQGYPAYSQCSSYSGAGYSPQSMQGYPQGYPPQPQGYIYPPQPQGYPPQPQGYPVAQPSASNSVLPLSIDSLCCVCRLSKSVILLRPCNHLCLCEGCSKEEAGLLQEKCPICRETILDSFNYYKVFTS